MSFFKRITNKGNQPSRNPRKHGSFGPHSRKPQKSSQWRSGTYKKLSEDRKDSVDRILTVLEYKAQ